MGNITKEIPARSNRIPDAERQALLDRLDKADEENPNKNRRGLPRVMFRKNDIAVRIHHPGGTSIASTVASRNLSEGGLSFLYNGYLHAKTKVEIALQRRLGGQDSISGIVQHCALVHRQIHLVGVKFHTKIFPKLYVDPTEWGELGEVTNVDPQQLTGTVLHLDDQELDRVLLGHFLKGTKIKLISTATLDEAIAAIARESIDCVMLDLNMKDATGEKAFVAMRDAGFTGPVGVLTAETDAARIRAIQNAGACAVLGKPYDAQNLLSLLATWLAAGATDSEAIFSTMSDQEAMKPLISQYVDRLHALSKDMRKKFDSGDLAGVRQQYQAIRGTGSSFGFAMLSEIARDAVASIDEPRSQQDRAMNMQRVEQACRRTKKSA